MKINFAGNSPTRRQCSLHPSGGLHRRQRCFALRANCRASDRQNLVADSMTDRLSSKPYCLSTNTMGIGIVSPSPVTLPTPPNMRVRIQSGCAGHETFSLLAARRADRDPCCGVGRLRAPQRGSIRSSVWLSGLPAGTEPTRCLAYPRVRWCVLVLIAAALSGGQ